MSPEEERQQIRERAQWLLYVHEHELRPHDEEKMCRYCAVAAMDIPALLAALDGETQRADDNFTTYERVKENASRLQTERDEWKRRVEMAQFDEQSFYGPQVARLQQERETINAAIRKALAYGMQEEADNLLHEALLVGEARTP